MTADSVIIKVNETVIALKPFWVHWGKQDPANFNKCILHYGKETHRANGSSELQRKKQQDESFFLKLSEVVAIRNESWDTKAGQLSKSVQKPKPRCEWECMEAGSSWALQGFILSNWFLRVWNTEFICHLAHTSGRMLGTSDRAN